jgi:lipopolysaccharide export system permease protein
VRLLQRYLFREVLQAWIAVTGVLLIILLSNSLATVLSRAADGQVQRGFLLTLLWLSTLQQLVLLVPIGLFLGIMLALGRLYHESELAAMQACGVGDAQLYRPVLILSVLAALVLAGLSFIVVPNSNAQTQEIKNAALRETRFSSLEPGKFRSVPGGIVFYAESRDDQGVLHNVYAERNKNGKVEVVRAARAEQRGVGSAQQTFVLFDGERYEGEPGGAKFRIIRFAEHGIPVALPEAADPQIKAEAKPTADILRSPDILDRAEWQWRISSPVLVLVLAFLAVPLARLKPRQGRYAKVGQFILIYFIYANLLAAAKVWIERGKMPAELGLWWVHALMLGLALALWARTGALRLPSRTPVALAAAG